MQCEATELFHILWSRKQLQSVKVKPAHTVLCNVVRVYRSSKVKKAQVSAVKSVLPVEQLARSTSASIFRQNADIQVESPAKDLIALILNGNPHLACSFKAVLLS